MAQVIQIKVTNENDFDIEDMFDGKTYVFKKGGEESVTIPLEAAQHIFGYDPKGGNPQQMFDYVSRRWGWNTPEYLKDGKGMQLFANVVLQPVAYIMREQVLDESSLAPPREGAGEQPQAESEDEDGEDQSKKPVNKASLKLGKKTISTEEAAA